MKRVGIAALLFCLGISGASASGATVSFDFRGDSLPTANTWVDASSGVAVTAVAQSSIAKQTGFPLLTIDPNEGLGVSSFNYPVVGGDPSLINLGESIKFAFSPAIEVNSITFSQLQGSRLFGDYVALSYFDGTTVRNLAGVHAEGSGPYDTYVYTLPTAVTAVTFTIGSASHLLNCFGVAGITVDYAGSTRPTYPEPNSVGIPAALWEGLAVLSALAGIRFWSRRRLAAA